MKKKLIFKTTNTKNTNQRAVSCRAAEFSKLAISHDGFASIAGGSLDGPLTGFHGSETYQNLRW